LILEKIRVAIAGVGNCASSLMQGVAYYGGKSVRDVAGLMHWDIGGYKPSDIEVVCAFDIDRRKVGKDVSDAIFSPPNCTAVFHRKVPRRGVRVRMGRILDSVAPHMGAYDPRYSFVPASAKEATQKDVVRALRSSGAEILINYLPAGSEEAVRFYAQCALEAGVGFINNIPVFIASDLRWGRRFEKANLPVIGDDIKSQLGATIVHRVLTHLFNVRGVRLERTYQLNIGGNTDFLNMLDRSRLSSKRISKTEAVQSQARHRLPAERIHIGPSDWVAWQKDNKVCFLRMEGRLFGDVPMHLEMRLSVEDSPNSGGVVIDAIRCMKLALKRKQGGILYGPSAYFMKHPPRQFTDEEAFQMTEDFIEGQGSGRKSGGKGKNKKAGTVAVRKG